MSDSLTGLRRKIKGAGDLQSVVRTMKAIAASSIGQYENSIHALVDYARSVELGLGVCFRNNRLTPFISKQTKQCRTPAIGVVVFGSDQGLVGQFNDIVADFAVKALKTSPGEPQIWAVGERVCNRLTDEGLNVKELFTVPTSVKAITPLVGQILIECEEQLGHDDDTELHIFYNCPKSAGTYTQIDLQLLPMNIKWLLDMAALPWPTKYIAEVIDKETPAVLQALISEYLFISLFRVCAESLASENMSRLTAMQRAEKNITELLNDLIAIFHRLRKNTIDEELFDVIAGFELLSTEEK